MLLVLGLISINACVITVFQLMPVSFTFRKVSPGDTGWDVFSLDYHVDGPISTVSALTLKNYSKMEFK